MRDIIFRGKRLEPNELYINQWVYGFFTRCDKSGNCYITTQTNVGGAHQHKVYPESIGQYTNKKDEYAKEIYEGDLLLIEIHDFNTGKIIASETCEVMFKGDRFGVKFGNAQEFTGLCDFSNTTFEVVGNVFESKE
ncbi:YopX family protein [Dehalobacter sp. DCM]|uniref:YopX family protein n=1 Tax=Dehalobacter sp. DCM TaxID=2907827 RepID=UPI003081E3E3|nr:YopX family protein [Dehalobacter sp. DCM]